jgi:hypothetical protein
MGSICMRIILSQRSPRLSASICCGKYTTTPGSSFCHVCSVGWEPGEPLLRSSLARAVNWLVEDCIIEMTLTCLVSSFMGLLPKAPIVAMAGARPTTAGTWPGRAKPFINTAIHPNCKKMVNAFNASYLTMSFLTLIKQGGLKFSGLQVRGKEDCSSFGLLGWCLGCTYNHVACTVSTD